ncbi:MAG: ABC transporter ATP-binding protein [candidate division NC10 bacterium]
MASRIIVRNVDAGYGAVRVLHRLSIEVREGETVVLLGTNGNGKSTLMKCIMGMVRPDAGEIFLERDGQRIELVGKSPEEIVNLGITLVPEGRRLFPKLTVEENLLLGAYRTDARRDIGDNLRFCYEAFPILEQRKRQLAGSMSGGEQQMLAVARAIMSAPRILLVDEPSLGLAPIFVSRVIAKIKELKERYQLTVLMAEQNFNQATKIADRGYIIVHGEIAFEGASTKELGEHELVKRYYLGV